MDQEQHLAEMLGASGFLSAKPDAPSISIESVVVVPTVINGKTESPTETPPIKSEPQLPRRKAGPLRYVLGSPGPLLLGALGAVMIAFAFDVSSSGFAVVRGDTYSNYHYEPYIALCVGDDILMQKIEWPPGAGVNMGGRCPTNDETRAIAVIERRVGWLLPWGILLTVVSALRLAWLSARDL